jgi:RNA-binding protein
MMKEKKMVMQLTGGQRKFLRGLAHHLNPGAFVGAKGVTPALVAEIDAALDGAELIKIKFGDHKDKSVKTALLDEISRQTGAAVAGMVGHVAVLYRPHKNPDKRRIKLP